MTASGLDRDLGPRAAIVSQPEITAHETSTHLHRSRKGCPSSREGVKDESVGRRITPHKNCRQARVELRLVRRVMTPRSPKAEC